MKRTGPPVCRDLSLPIRSVALASSPSTAGALANGDGDAEDEAAAKPAGKALLSPKQRKALMKQAIPPHHKLLSTKQLLTMP